MARFGVLTLAQKSSARRYRQAWKSLSKWAFKQPTSKHHARNIHLSRIFLERRDSNPGRCTWDEPNENEATGMSWIFYSNILWADSAPPWRWFKAKYWIQPFSLNLRHPSSLLQDSRMFHQPAVPLHQSQKSNFAIEDVVSDINFSSNWFILRIDDWQRSL